MIMLQLKKLRDALSEAERQKLLDKHQDPMRKAYNLMLEIKRQQEDTGETDPLLVNASMARRSTPHKPD